MTVAAIVWASLAGFALTAAIVSVRLVFVRHVADVVLILQLLSAKAIGAFFLFAAMSGVAAYAEIALAIAFLGAVIAAVFASRRPS